MWGLPSSPLSATLFFSLFHALSASPPPLPSRPLLVLVTLLPSRPLLLLPILLPLCLPLAPLFPATVASELVHTIIRQLAHATSAPAHNSTTSSSSISNSTASTTCHSSSSLPHLSPIHSTIITSLAAADAFPLHQLAEALLSHLAALSAALPTTASTASSSGSGSGGSTTSSSSSRSGSVPETVLQVLFQGLLAQRHPQAV
ncbi:unnamed protein product [Closterium sp. NIES-53]